VPRGACKGASAARCISGIEEGNEYEYVWDMPSNMMHRISKSVERPDLVQVDKGGGGGGVTGRGIEEDTFNSSRGQCSCLRQTQTLPRGLSKSQHTKGLLSTAGPPAVAAALSGGSAVRTGTQAGRGRFSSLEARSRPPPPTKSDKLKFDSGPSPGPPRVGYRGESSAARTCRQCGHAITEYTAGGIGRGIVPPGSGPMMRRIPPAATNDALNPAPSGRGQSSSVGGGTLGSGVPPDELIDAAFSSSAMTSSRPTVTSTSWLQAQIQ